MGSPHVGGARDPPTPPEHIYWTCRLLTKTNSGHVRKNKEPNGRPSCFPAHRRRTYEPAATEAAVADIEVRTAGVRVRGRGRGRANLPRVNPTPIPLNPNLSTLTPQP